MTSREKTRAGQTLVPPAPPQRWWFVHWPLPTAADRRRSPHVAHSPCAALSKLSNAHNHEQLHRLASQLKEQEMTITLWKKWEHTQSIFVHSNYEMQIHLTIFSNKCRGLVRLYHPLMTIGEPAPWAAVSPAPAGESHTIQLCISISGARMVGHVILWYIVAI